MNLITDKFQLQTECLQYDSFLNSEISDDMYAVTDRGCRLAVIISRTGKMLADAKYWLNERKRVEVLEVISQIKDNKLSSKIQNALIDSICKEEQYIVDWCERLNRSATHQLDWCRTLISKAKEEMRLNGSNF